MNEIMMSGIAIGCNLIIFFLFGVLFLKVVKRTVSLRLAFIAGLFVYFGCFSIVFLPCMLLRTSFSLMMKLWLVVCLILCLYVLFSNYQIIIKLVKEVINIKLSVLEVGLLFLVIVCWSIFLYYLIRSPYMGYDTAFYSRVVERAVNDNIMNPCFYGEKYVSFRYALSSYYFHAAIVAKIFGLQHFTTLKLVMGGLCGIYATGVMTYILSALFKSFYIVCGGIIIWIVAMFAFNGMYNQAGFLLYRAYEAKAWCSNIIIPLLVFCGFLLWRKKEDDVTRPLIVLIAATAYVLSMSSLIVVPAALLCIFIPLIVVDRDKRDVKTLLLSLGCSVAFLIFFMLMTKFVKIPV